MSSILVAKAVKLEIMLITHMPMVQSGISIKRSLVITQETLARFGKPGCAGTEEMVAGGSSPNYSP